MRNLDGSSVIVTGGAGFIGSHLVDGLLGEGAKLVVVVDTFFLGSESNLANASAHYGPRLLTLREDAGDEAAMAELCRRHRPDLVFNLATKPLLYSFFNPPGAYRTSVDIALTLAELQRSGAFERMVHVSSSEVYGTAVETPMTEEHPFGALTTYAAGKAAADLALASYVYMFGLNIVTIRPFNNFGPRQNDRDLAAVVPRTIRRVLNGEPPIIEGDGSQTRDFIFVKDTVSAMLRLAIAEDVAGSVFNIGSGQETTIRELIEETCSALDYSGPIEKRPMRAADVRRHVASVAKAEAKIGKLAVTSVSAGLPQTIEWYKKSRR